MIFHYSRATTGRHVRSILIDFGRSWGLLGHFGGSKAFSGQVFEEGAGNSVRKETAGRPKRRQEAPKRVPKAPKMSLKRVQNWDGKGFRGVLGRNVVQNKYRSKSKTVADLREMTPASSHAVRTIYIPTSRFTIRTNRIKISVDSSKFSSIPETAQEAKLI